MKKDKILAISDIVGYAAIGFLFLPGSTLLFGGSFYATGKDKIAMIVCSIIGVAFTIMTVNDINKTIYNRGKLKAYKEISDKLDKNG